MIKDRWLLLSLFSLIGILGFGVLQTIFSSFISPIRGMQKPSMGMGQGMMGGMMGQGMGAGQGITGEKMGFGMGGISSGSLVGSLFNFLFSILIFLAVTALFVGLIGFIYSYIKRNEAKVEITAVEGGANLENTTVESKSTVQSNAVEYIKRNFLTKSETKDV